MRLYTAPQLDFVSGAGYTHCLSRSFAAVRPYLYLVVLVWIDFYVCRKAFHTEFTVHFNSMHGEWIALARLGDYSWWHASWWPWWGAGSPLDYVYAPLVPVLTAFLTMVSHHSLALSFNQLSGAVYCLAPATMYLVSWRISGSAGYSFIAGAAASLLSPFEWVVPGDPFHWSIALEPRLLLLVFDWDEVPHLIAVALLPPLVWFLWRALRTKRAADFIVSGIIMATMMLSNAFGMVLIAFTAISLPMAMNEGPRLANMAWAGMTAVCSWIVVSPWLPPSLILRMRTMSALVNETSSGSGSLAALSIVAVVFAAVFLSTRQRVTHWGFRWLLLFSSILLPLPILDRYAHIRFLPQTVRYKVEAEFLVAWLVVFSLRPLLSRMPPVARVVPAIVLLGFAGSQLVAFGREARWWRLQSVDARQSIEYQTAKWMEQHLPGERVMMPGSIGYWADAFENIPQAGAEPFTTSPNLTQYVAQYFISSGDGGDQAGVLSTLWLKAFGARAVVVPGSGSPEYWHPFHNPRQFDGVLPAVWRERDTAAYQVSNGPWSLAHVIRPEDLVTHAPVNGLDVGELRRYVAAIEDPAAPQATVTWRGNNQVEIDARIEPGEVVSAQITWDPGWHARVNGVRRPIIRDGIGLIAVDTGCAGSCHAELTYDGGTERRVCRIAGVSLPAMLLMVFFSRRMLKKHAS